MSGFVVLDGAVVAQGIDNAEIIETVPPAPRPNAAGHHLAPGIAGTMH
jgi:hypothetical protein